jgi:tetratricopeptide (TPR) repeat protein
VALSLIGAANLRQGKFSEAEGHFRRMLTIYERRLGPQHEDTAAALNSLALVLEKLGDYPGAETLLKRAAGILERKFGQDHPSTATVTSNLARVLDSQGKFAATQKPAPGAPGRGDDAAQIAVRAEDAIRRGQYSEAETLHHQVLAIHEKTLGAEHPTTATSMSNLARVLDIQGKHGEAEKLYRRSLSVREKVLGTSHPDVATNLNNLAKVLQELGKDEQVTLAEQRARARAGAMVGALTEVEGMYRRALAIQDQTLGRDHPDTANTLNNLGAMLSVRGDFAQAEEMSRAALRGGIHEEDGGNSGRRGARAFGESFRGGRRGADQSHDRRRLLHQRRLRFQGEGLHEGA